MYLLYREWKAVFWIRNILVRIRIRTTDSRIQIRIQILLFSSVADKMPTKNKFFFHFFCSFYFEGTFTSVYIKVEKKGWVITAVSTDGGGGGGDAGPNKKATSKKHRASSLLVAELHDAGLPLLQHLLVHLLRLLLCNPGKKRTIKASSYQAVLGISHILVRIRIRIRIRLLSSATLRMQNKIFFLHIFFL